MPRRSPATAIAVSRLGGLKRSGVPSDDPRYDESRRIVIAEGLTEHVKRVVAGWPKLTDEQLDRIAGLLRSGGRQT